MFPVNLLRDQITSNLARRFDTFCATTMPKFIHFCTSVIKWAFFQWFFFKNDLWPTFPYQDDLFTQWCQLVKCSDSHGLSSCQISTPSTQPFKNCRGYIEFHKMAATSCHVTSTVPISAFFTSSEMPCQSYKVSRHKHVALNYCDFFFYFPSYFNVHAFTSHVTLLGDPQRRISFWFRQNLLPLKILSHWYLFIKNLKNGISDQHEIFTIAWPWSGIEMLTLGVWSLKREDLQTPFCEFSSSLISP